MLLCLPRSLAAAPATPLARGGRALLPVVVGPSAAPAVKAAAADLARTLGRLGGADFELRTGDGREGILVGRPSDFAHLPWAVTFGTGPFEREHYLLRSDGQMLALLGASEQAVSDAVWDLCGRLGYRQFFPGPTWEVLPPPADLALAVDQDCQPAFAARRIWYNWGLWGYNDEPYRQWCVRNRAVKGFDLNSGHAYEAIIAARRAQFEQHPDYFALVAGERKFRGGDTKFCVANLGLRQLVVDWAMEQVRARPALDSLSLEPSDGANWCECDACARLGGVSDRVVTLANAVAQAINGLGLGEKYVGIYAYNRHATPPRLRVDPHVIVSATTAFIGGGLTLEQVVRGWRAQGATIGIYDYLSVVDWDWNLPRGGAGSRPRTVAAELAHYHDLGARFYDAEAGDCWGPCGLGYYVASRVMWDLAAARQVDALLADFIDRAFAGVQGPMREFYHLLNDDSQRRPPADLLGRLYRQLDAARRGTTDARVVARLDDLTLYVRHAELYQAYANGTGSVEAVARHAYRIRRTMMVHSYGLWCRLVSQQAALTPNHPWKSEEPFGPDELARLLAEGMAHNQPVEPGFVGREYSRKLVPALPALRLSHVSPGSFPTEPQDHQRYWVWLPAGTSSLNVTIRVQKVWANRLPAISLYSPLEVTGQPVATDSSYRPDGEAHALRLATPYAGLHRVETVDGGDYSRLTWPAGLPVTVESGIDTTELASHFRGAWSLYCYVPRGTQVVGGWAARVANWAPRVSGKLLDGDGHEVYDFGPGGDGWFRVPVPAGQDGRLWQFVQSQGLRQLMTVPPYLARSGEELLLPAEVVAADAAR